MLFKDLKVGDLFRITSENTGTVYQKTSDKYCCSNSINLISKQKKLVRDTEEVELVQ